jgi:hypothetical protein
VKADQIFAKMLSLEGKSTIPILAPMNTRWSLTSYEPNHSITQRLMLVLAFSFICSMIFGQSPADIYARLCEQEEARQTWQDPASPTATPTPTAKPKVTARQPSQDPASPTATPTPTAKPKVTPTKTIKINRAALKVEPVTPLKP